MLMCMHRFKMLNIFYDFTTPRKYGVSMKLIKHELKKNIDEEKAPMNTKERSKCLSLEN